VYPGSFTPTNITHRNAGDWDRPHYHPVNHPMKLRPSSPSQTTRCPSPTPLSNTYSCTTVQPEPAPNNFAATA
ncbi:hypothetical protein J6590_019802, partial [Homalodisca vitripennis]